MQNEYRLIALDMDGTLLNSRHEITPRAKRGRDDLVLAVGHEILLEALDEVGGNRVGGVALVEEGAQCNSQHSLRDVFYRFMDITKTHSSICVQRNKHQHRPLISQAAQHISYRTISYRMKVFHSLTFCILLSSNNSYLYVTSLFSSTLLHFSN